MTGPPPPWTPAFVQDTLAPLVGGPFKIQYGGAHPDATGRGLLAGLTVPPDSVNVYAASPHPEHTLIHEAGHVWDARAVAPQITGGLLAERAQADPYSRQHKYFTGSDDEYVAESFAQALELLRRTKGNPSSADLTEAEGNFPGITNVVGWMLSRPPFGGPLADNR